MGEGEEKLKSAIRKNKFCDHIGYLQAKVLKNGLKSRFFRLGGVHRSGWWTPIFVFFDAAVNMAIGEKIVLSGKSILSRKSLRVP